MLTRMWSNRNSLITDGNAKVVQPRWKTVSQFLTKLNILVAYDPAVTPLDIYPK